MTKKARNYHVGGTQLPLITPESAWVPPTSLPDLRHLGRLDLGVDVETRDDGLAARRGPGWPRRAGYVAGVALAWGDQKLYAPIRHPDTECLDRALVAGWLRAHLAHPDIRCVFHNGPYDLGWLLADLDVPPPAELDDTGGMAAMVDENRLSYTLDDLCRWRGVPGKDERLLREAAAAYGFSAKAELWRLPARYVGDYAAQDPASTVGLAASLRPELDAQGVTRAYQTEMDLVPMILEMTRRGVRINVERAEEAQRELIRRRDELLADLSHRAGRAVTIDHCRSPQSLMELHAAEGIQFPRNKPTKKQVAAGEDGLGSFTKDWMKKHPHWLPSGVNRVRVLTDAAEKFIGGFLLGYAVSYGYKHHRLHASVNQFRSSDEGEDGGSTRGTRSHRFSYADPPLQQMPARDEELTSVIRGAFEPEDGETWAAADYSQQEYRLIVHYAAEMNLTGAAAAVRKYVEDPDTDFHNYVVDITGLDRKPAKDTNFAKSYGAGIPKFAAMIGKSVEEAAAIFEQYDRELPFVSQLGEKCQQLVERRGWIRLLDGARSHFDFWESWGTRLRDGTRLFLPATTHARALLWVDNMEATHGIRPRIRRADARKGMNRLIQGSAARQMKMAMVACWREGIVPLLQMHDELDFSLGEEAVGRRVAEIMRSVEAHRLRVPMLVDVEYGPNWGHARKIKGPDGKVAYAATWGEARALAPAA